MEKFVNLRNGDSRSVGQLHKLRNVYLCNRNSGNIFRSAGMERSGARSNFAL